MNNPVVENMNIFLSLDQNIFKGYFNAQDPAPIYKRQLSHDFEDYIMTTIAAAKRHTQFSYRISYKNDSDKQYADPLMYAVRRHFGEKKLMLYASFEKFKKRSYLLLFLSLAVVMICQGILPLVLDSTYRLHTGISNGMDVFSWVILWRPIDKLIFQWNPYLKDISIADRLEKGEACVTEVAC